MDIDINALQWVDISGEDSPPNSRLLVSITFSGVFHHLEAIAVAERDGLQLTVDGRWDDTLGDYYKAAGGDRPFLTVAIRGRKYVLVMTPYCD